MPEKYTSEDGTFLVVGSFDPGVDAHQEQRFYLAWFFPSKGEMGANVGEIGVAEDTPPRSLSDWEAWIVDKAVAPMAEEKGDLGYAFKSQQTAQRALDVANAALHTRLNWQEMAQAAGWAPPCTRRHVS